jgi:hypothetical protein
LSATAGIATILAMDAHGCLISAALLLGVFVAFGIVGRIIDGAIAEIRYTIAPGVVSGMRAWETSRDVPADPPAPPPPNDTGDGADAAGAELEVAVGRVRPGVRAVGRQQAAPVPA